MARASLIHAILDKAADALTRGLINLSLSTALRLFVLGYYREAATEPGHIAAGHGNTARRH